MQHHAGWIVGAVALALVGSAPTWAIGCSADRSGPSVSPAVLADRMEAKRAPLILDVRSVSEFASGHIPAALNFPHHELPDRIAELPLQDDPEIVVYCERGGRARAAIEVLRAAGLSRVLHLEGDMRAWRASGLPCVGC